MWPKRSRETIRGKQIKIEVWEQPGYHTTYNAYVFCPLKECDGKDALQANNRSTEGAARSGAKKAITSHLKKVHNL